MGFFSDNSSDAYERAIAQAEVDSSKLTSDQKDKLRKLQSESGSRGNRARRALGG